MMRIRKILMLLVIVLAGLQCTGELIPPNPLIDLRTELKDIEQYTIILEDMDLVQQQYKHKYKVFKIQSNDEVEITITDWKEVDDDFFALHEANLGMEILSKEKLSTGQEVYNNLASPPGFYHFVGNETYGLWTVPDKEDTLNIIADTSYVWEFYSKFSELEEALELKGLAVNKGEFLRYTNKYRQNRPFYGDIIAKDSTKFGTYSRHWVLIRPLFFNRRYTHDYFNKTPVTGGGISKGFRGGGGNGK